MKRDFEIIRRVLMDIDDDDTRHLVFNTKDFCLVYGIDDHELVQHQVDVLIQSNLVNHSCARSMEGNISHIFCLTWQGYDFLTNIRNDNHWSDIYYLLDQKNIGMSVYSISEASASLLRNALLS
jgi:hypothetical protein